MVKSLTQKFPINFERNISETWFIQKNPTPTPRRKNRFGVLSKVHSSNSPYESLNYVGWYLLRHRNRINNSKIIDRIHIGLAWSYLKLYGHLFHKKKCGNEKNNSGTDPSNNFFYKRITCYFAWVPHVKSIIHF